MCDRIASWHITSIIYIIYISAVTSAKQHKTLNLDDYCQNLKKTVTRPDAFLLLSVICKLFWVASSARSRIKTVWCPIKMFDYGVVSIMRLSEFSLIWFWCVFLSSLSFCLVVSNMFTFMRIYYMYLKLRTFQLTSKMDWNFEGRVHQTCIQGKFSDVL